jgi:hypothetical protein
MAFAVLFGVILEEAVPIGSPRLLGRRAWARPGGIRYGGVLVRSQQDYGMLTLHLNPLIFTLTLGQSGKSS